MTLNDDWRNKERFKGSGNTIIDEFIFEKNLNWIPYNELENIKYLDKGGFSSIYKAIWLDKDILLDEGNSREVILKCPNNMNGDLSEFLNEWKYHSKFLGTFEFINFYGLTKNPDTLNYMVVMNYANQGNLRGNLTKLHMNGLIHCDFHDGNILNHDKDKIYISDLGLSRYVKSFLKNNDIYGVMTFMAPEILRGNSYTPASDVYSFSMIMWEFTSGIPPFNNRAHDSQLSLNICRGERPEIIENTPQCFIDLMKKCWNEDPFKRPSTKEVLVIIEKWIMFPKNMAIEDIDKELKHNVMEFINAPIVNNNPVTKPHSQAFYTSRLLDFSSKKLNEILDSQANVKVDEILVSEDFNDCIIKD
ncbi:kinase-like protein [Rhizophagus irregularis]|uniref:Kinase-like protein n=1 Tax=Rhizophagus irregularis TaxID=588596 RepID=A0A2N1NML1_9GLOM|nr:kinase-like protein [Rhizophagus irregularis]